MDQIRDLAISGVDTLEKAEKVREIVGDIETGSMNISRIEDWFYDDDLSKSFMHWWLPNKDNFKNCTQMTYDEFLDKYDFNGTKDVEPPRPTFMEKMIGKKEAHKIRKHQQEVMDDKSQMQKLYESEPDNWAVCIKQINKKNWAKCYRPKDLTWRNDFDYQLIRKSHEVIADEVIVNPNTKVYKLNIQGGKPIEVKDFFENYDKDWDYVLKDKQDSTNTLSITDEITGKVYEFEKPEFETRVSNLFRDSSVMIEIKHKVEGVTSIVKYLSCWLELPTGKIIGYGCNLTPIKPKKFIKTVQYYNDDTDEMFIVKQDFVSEDEFKETIKDCVALGKEG